VMKCVCSLLTYTYFPRWVTFECTHQAMRDAALTNRPKSKLRWRKEYNESLSHSVSLGTPGRGPHVPRDSVPRELCSQAFHQMAGSHCSGSSFLIAMLGTNCLTSVPAEMELSFRTASAFLPGYHY
jgi:hypothetical protein